ncbi:MAG TPA: DUF1328 domain-containing protein [Tepidisphaeraceae bacterium]|jgi:uncharacterized membrane protein YtjA (UPF0391 family)|nr:DUF1328 domain-containing protein [Tepidisphaeraceae bacterium]
MLTILSSALLAQALHPLIWWALVFFVIAIIAYLLGARGVAGMSAGVGRTLLFVFLVLAILFAIIGFINNHA